MLLMVLTSLAVYLLKRKKTKPKDQNNSIFSFSKIYKFEPA